MLFGVPGCRFCFSRQVYVSLSGQEAVHPTALVLSAFGRGDARLGDDRTGPGVPWTGSSAGPAVLATKFASPRSSDLIVLVMALVGESLMFVLCTRRGDSRLRSVKVDANTSRNLSKTHRNF